MIRFRFILGFLCFAGCFCVIAWMIGAGMVGTMFDIMTPIWAMLAAVVLFTAGMLIIGLVNPPDEDLKARRRWITGTASGLISVSIGLLFAAVPSIAQGFSLVGLTIVLFGAVILAGVAVWALWPMSLHPARRAVLYAGW